VGLAAPPLETVGVGRRGGAARTPSRGRERERRIGGQLNCHSAAAHQALKPSRSTKSAASPDTAHARTSNRARTDEHRCRADEQQMPDFGVRSVSLLDRTAAVNPDSSQPRPLIWNDLKTLVKRRVRFCSVAQARHG
jgi:hypothetical protein